LYDDFRKPTGVVLLSASNNSYALPHKESSLCGDPIFDYDLIMSSSSSTLWVNIVEGYPEIRNDLKEPIYEIVFVIIELRFINMSLTNQVKHYTDSLLLEAESRKKYFNNHRKSWENQFGLTIKTLPALIRIYSKSLKTLMLKLAILINRAEELNLEKRRRLPKGAVNLVKSKCPRQPKELFEIIEQNEYCNLLLKRRDNTEHNIEKIFQYQISRLIEIETFEEMENFIANNILIDVETTNLATENIVNRFTPALKSYLAIIEKDGLKK
jgi:hypothetical protein